MKKRKIFALLTAAVLFTGALTGCGGSSDKAGEYADGTYEGTSSVFEGDEEGNGEGYGVATITIEDNVVTACEFHTYQPDGTLKGSDYGKKGGEVANADFYNKAQRAVLACQKYAEQLAETGSLSDVDAISGATISYHEFQEAVENALEQAAK